MADCCENKACALDALRIRQSSTLKIVLVINAVMFVVELVAGMMAGSTALLSDSLDNLGDALTYGLSLYAIASAPRSKAKVAMFKGILILVAGIFVLSQVAIELWIQAFQPMKPWDLSAYWHCWQTALVLHCSGSTIRKILI